MANIAIAVQNLSFAALDTLIGNDNTDVTESNETYEKVTGNEEKMRLVRIAFNMSPEEPFLDDCRCTLLNKEEFVLGTLCVTKNFAAFYNDFPLSAAQNQVDNGECSKDGKYWRKCIVDMFDRTISIYKSQRRRDRREPKYIIPISDVHSVVKVEEVESQRPHCFQLLTSEQRYYISFADEETLNRWMSAIKQRVNGCSKKEFHTSLKVLIPFKSVASINKIHRNLVFKRARKIVMNSRTEFLFTNLPLKFHSLTSAWNAIKEKTEYEGEESSDSRSRSSSFNSQEPEHKLAVKDQSDAQNMEFHRLFHLPDTEYRCSLVKMFTVIGSMFVSPNFVCFISNYFGLKTRIVIPMRDIIDIRKDHISLLYLKAIIVATRDKEFVFSTFASRSMAFETLEAAWENSQRTLINPDLMHEIVVEESFCDYNNEISTNLNVVMLIVGSRGDVQPFIAFAHGLTRAGHKVRIVTHEVHRQFVTGWNFEFTALAGDPKKLLKFMVEQKRVTPEFILEGLKEFGDFFEDLLLSEWNACKQDTDVIVQNPPAFGGVHIAEKLGIPLFVAFTMPWSRTTAFPHPFAVPPVPLGAGYNYSTYIAVEQAMWQPTRNKVNRFREEVLNIHPIELWNSVFSAGDQKHIPHLYCWSPSVLPKPGDWLENISVTGYWFLDAPQEWKPPPELVTFLAKEPKPLYIGFGSVAVDEPQKVTDLFLEALKECGQRAILGKGWGGFVEDVKYPDYVFVVDSVPHDWLFPQVSAVIHHGGAGTCAAGFKAGCPTLVVPFFGDQFFWGNIVAERGLGVPPLPLKQMTVSKLAAAVTKLVTCQEIKARCLTLAEHINSQDGVSRAVEIFHKQLRRFPKRATRWLVSVSTGNERGASLNRGVDIFACFYAGDERTDLIELTRYITPSLLSFHKRFPRGKTVKFEISTKFLQSPLTSLLIVLAHSGTRTHTWFLESISVENIATSEIWEFPYHNWIEIPKGQKEIEFAINVAPKTG